MPRDWSFRRAKSSSFPQALMGAAFNPVFTGPQTAPQKTKDKKKLGFQSNATKVAL
jgi:hypothetical protein